MIWKTHKSLQIPNRASIRIAWIAGSSHSLLIEAPQAVAKLLEEFIRSQR